LQLTIDSISLSILIGGFALVWYYYVTYFNAPEITRYPPEIARTLRRALYYTNIDPQPQLARKYYKKALEQCEEMHLDPFMDEVMGIKIQISFWLEKSGYYKNAILNLETLLTDCRKWVEAMEKGMADGTLDTSGIPPKRKATDEYVGTLPNKDGEEYVPENLWHKRTRLLAKSVAISVKLGDLYSDEHVMEPEHALARLTWAVETSLTEARRRSADGAKDVEGDWLKPQEIGGALEGDATINFLI
jgi:hypothetical protein